MGEFQKGIVFAALVEAAGKKIAHESVPSFIGIRTRALPLSSTMTA